MAKRKAARRFKGRKTVRKRSAAQGSVKRPKLGARKAAKSTARARAAAKTRARAAAKTRARAAAKARARLGAAMRAPRRVPHLDRERRTLAEEGVIPTPPSSLNMDRHGSAARSGRAELVDNLRKHGRMTPGITGGDVDADFENAYFSGDEAPGGDNPTPDQEVVEDIGKALGVQYEDNEELRASDKVSDRDKHRWELDPASSEDYKERK